MVAHSQFCWSGDHTVEAAEQSIDAVRRSSGDHGSDGGDHGDDDAKKFVFLLSDANLRRYAIDPAYIGKVLTRDEDVKVRLSSAPVTLP